MKKDVIYIDIEDDITSIIEKVKTAEAKIVALVPPKRIGVLQSAVNLKLLQRGAGSAGKRVVIITNDHSLAALAGGVSIPVAKNLQSKPELAPIAALEVDDNDVINGEELPVGELAQMNPASAAIVNSPDMDETAKEISDALRTPVAGAPLAAAAAKKAKKGGPKIPNFDTFRKKLFLFGGLGVFLIGFLVWAIWFAPHATITIAAKTDTVNINEKLILDPNIESDLALGRLAPVVKELKKSTSAEFDTTGTKEIGNKASGKMTLSNGSDSDPIPVAAGTVFTATNGLQFTSNSDVTVPGARLSGGRIVAGSASVTVTASAVGPEYNLASQSYTSSNSSVSAQGDQMSGGSKETVSIVAAEDVEKAKQQLSSQNDSEVKKELSGQFDDKVQVIQESFKVTPGTPASSPGVGEQAKRARLTLETTYSLVGLEKDDIKNLLEDRLNDEIDDDAKLRIYSNGEKDLKFSEFQAVENGLYSARITTTGHIGPQVKEDELAKQLSGKRYGEIEQIVKQTEGVEHVNIKFSPFWVNKAPAENKITIKFTVENR